MPPMSSDSAQRTSNLVTVDEVARYLGMSKKWVYVAAERGEIPSYLVGRSRRFRMSAIEKWLEERAS